MNRLSVLLVAICFLTQVSLGQKTYQSSNAFWSNGYFKDLPNSYVEVVSAFDSSLEDAKNKAANEVIKRRSIATGTESIVDVNGNNVNVISNHQLIVKSRIIDEYYVRHNNGYTVYLLVQTAKNPNFQFESVSISNEYNVSARAFLPGMAQIYKGSKVKGYSIIAMQALSIGGIILCENERSTNIKKSIEHPKFAVEYSGRASDWSTARDICIGVAAGIYVYNIIDAYVAKGKTRLVFDSYGSGLAISPHVSSHSVGLNLAYNF